MLLIIRLKVGTKMQAICCFGCKKAFPSMDLLFKHKTTCAVSNNVASTSSYKCGECDKVFKSGDKSEQHYDVTVHGYECDVCEKKFTFPEFLAQHQKPTRYCLCFGFSCLRSPTTLS